MCLSWETVRRWGRCPVGDGAAWGTGSFEKLSKEWQAGLAVPTAAITTTTLNFEKT